VSSELSTGFSTEEEICCEQIIDWYDLRPICSNRLAHRAGVTKGIVAPKTEGFLSGLSSVFTTGVAHKLRRGAVLQDVAALHVAIGFESSSISTQVAALRSLLLGGGEGNLAACFDDVVKVCKHQFFLAEYDGQQLLFFL
jgi:hypothetical protein